MFLCPFCRSPHSPPHTNEPINMYDDLAGMPTRPTHVERVIHLIEMVNCKRPMGQGYRCANVEHSISRKGVEKRGKRPLQCASHATIESFLCMHHERRRSGSPGILWDEWGLTHGDKGPTPPHPGPTPCGSTHTLTVPSDFTCRV